LRGAKGGIGLKQGKPIVVTVYGAETICAGCHNLPSSRETASWLEAALGRNYGGQVRVRYVDIHRPEDKEDADFSRRVIEEELWYPVVVIAGEVVGEGNPSLKAIRKKLEQLGAERKEASPGSSV
jgi:disulfide oxidoreductase YuzD